MAGARLRSDFVEAGHLRLHHTHGGTGSAPVLFVHGLGSSGYMEWRFTLPAIGRDHPVHAPDLPGFGRSEKPRAEYGIPFFARVLDAYMQAVGVESAAVVGTSLGGRVALELAFQFPERVRKLVLVDALGLGRPAARIHYPLLTLPRLGEAAMRLVSGTVRRAPPAVLRRLAARYAGSSSDVESLMDDDYLRDLRELYAQEGYLEAYLATLRSLVSPRALAGGHDVTDRLRELGLPVRLIWGADDPLFPVEHATRAHGRLPGSRLAIVEGAGHTPQAERPEEFNRVLARFLDG